MFLLLLLFYFYLCHLTKSSSACRLSINSLISLIFVVSISASSHSRMNNVPKFSDRYIYPSKHTVSNPTTPPQEPLQILVFFVEVSSLSTLSMPPLRFHYPRLRFAQLADFEEVHTFTPHQHAQVAHYLLACSIAAKPQSHLLGAQKVLEEASTSKEKHPLHYQLWLLLMFCVHIQ